MSEWVFFLAWLVGALISGVVAARFDPEWKEHPFGLTLFMFFWPVVAILGLVVMLALLPSNTAIWIANYLGPSPPQTVSVNAAEGTSKE